MNPSKVDCPVYGKPSAVLAAHSAESTSSHSSVWPSVPTTMTLHGSGGNAVSGIFGISVLGATVVTVEPLTTSETAKVVPLSTANPSGPVACPQPVATTTLAMSAIRASAASLTIVEPEYLRLGERHLTRT